MNEHITENTKTTEKMGFQELNGENHLNIGRAVFIEALKHFNTVKNAVANQTINIDAILAKVATSLKNGGGDVESATKLSEFGLDVQSIILNELKQVYKNRIVEKASKILSEELRAGGELANVEREDAICTALMFAIEAMKREGGREKEMVFLLGLDTTKFYDDKNEPGIARELYNALDDKSHDVYFLRCLNELTWVDLKVEMLRFMQVVFGNVIEDRNTVHELNTDSIKAMKDRCPEISWEVLAVVHKLAEMEELEANEGDLIKSLLRCAGILKGFSDSGIIELEFVQKAIEDAEKAYGRPIEVVER